MSSPYSRQVFSRTSILFVCSSSPDETTSCSDVINPASSLFSCMTGSVSYKILFYINLMYSLEETDRRLATVLQIKTVWPPALHRGDKEEAELDGWMHKAPTGVLKSLYILWSCVLTPSQVFPTTFKPGEIREWGRKSATVMERKDGKLLTYTFCLSHIFPTTTQRQTFCSQLRLKTSYVRVHPSLTQCIK